ncbi:MTRF1L release factor glutamine methyltransferase-like isoform X2 [Liolophura sinensis]|uniref:MTRF1L release factor glutamine methyltransferase-like isoform X2 n=1 Tax=Liolophura sinensis TaxID=3198878 RepID=UPI00315970CC
MRCVNAFLYKVNLCKQARCISNTCSGYANITVEELISKWQGRFLKCSIPEPTCSVELLTAHALGRKTLNEVSPTQVLSEEQVTRVDELCTNRLTRLPVQYLIGEWDFLSLTLKMKPPVFIPRPETEELVTLVREGIKHVGANYTTLQFLDIGTGTGAIVIALLDLFPEARGVGVDTLPAACILTAENAELIGVNNRLTVLHATLSNDIYDWTKLTESFGKFDVIVSNPPYIPSGIVGDLEPEITRYEHHSALFSGEDGMHFIKQILQNTSDLLKSAGSLWLEVDLKHPQLVRQYVQEHDVGLTYVKTHRDFTNRVYMAYTHT